MNKKTPIAFALIALFLVSSLGLATAQTVSPTPNAVSGLTTGSFIRIGGIISTWGNTPARGLLNTQARIGTFENGDTRQNGLATVTWTTNLVRPIVAALAKQDFTYEFYEARLNRVSVSTLSATTKDNAYTLGGMWNVFTVTCKVTFDKNDQGQVIGVHRTMDRTMKQVTGTLAVAANWNTFTLSFDDVEIAQLTGSVVRSVIRQVAFNPFKVTDDISTNLVTKADVAAVIRAYGAMPGYGNYNPRMDLCGHFKIDLTALSTVASNM